MRSSPTRALIFVVTVMALLAHSRTAATLSTVAVVLSSRIGPYAVAADAMQAALARGVVPSEILVFDLEGEADAVRETFARMKDARPRVIVPVGSTAMAAVLADPTQIPVVFSMVLYPALHGFLGETGRGVTGAALDIPLEEQFESIRRLVPRARRVGVLYNQVETGALVQRARDVAARLGLTLVAREVERPEDAPAIFRELLPDVDVAWSVADSHVFTPQSTPALVLTALRQRVPFVGLSGAHVRNGALAALSVDYADVGVQTAELVQRVLKGEPAASLPPTSPRRVVIDLNLRTARHLGIEVAPEIVSAGSVLVP